MAELLILSNTDNQAYAKGDIIVVRGDGWQWGSAECLNKFVVVKKTGMSESDAKVYEQSLMDTSNPERSVMVKPRKYHISPEAVDDIALQVQDFVEITPVELTAEILEKTL